jgi:hypothetical protein
VITRLQEKSFSRPIRLFREFLSDFGSCTQSALNDSLLRILAVCSEARSALGEQLEKLLGNAAEE